ncbi:MAG: CoA transferase, partial [Myxococcota bacterium]
MRFGIKTADAMLSPYRVLDLTDDRGHLAGHLLAQLGADVIAVEPPGGQRARHLGPFVGDRRDPEASLSHWAYNRGKRSVVVDEPGQLETLARSADILIECGAMPVDLARLRRLNPALITVSITAFGQTGPKADWAATDLTVCAASGTLGITGDADRPPVRVGIPQSFGFAATDATCAALLALWERHRSGRGQHADISAQQSYTTATQFQTMAALVGKPAGGRIAGGVRLGPLTLQVVHPCKDGHVTAGFLFGPVFGPYTARLFSWIHEEGLCDASWAETDWIGFGLLLTEDPDVLRLMDEGTRILGRFTTTKTKAELLAAAVDRRLLLAPVMTTRDLLDFEQLRARQWWDNVDGVLYPGAFAKAPASPLRVLPRPPQLGEHTGEVLGEPLRPPALDAPSQELDDLPLAGLKVLDFTWALAGPAATRILADQGATVIRVESQRKPDAVRGATPFIAEDGQLENSLHWHSPNAGKLGFTLDLTHPLAKRVVLDLAAWADVVVESFSSGTMDRLGIGYEALREVNPRVIMLSSCLMGQTGPLRSYSGFGTAGAAIAGFYPLAGWPDRLPSGPFGAYSDYPSPRYTVAVLIGALEWRRRTGEGQYLDYAQIEGAAQLIAPAILDDAVNGRTATRRGNEDLRMAPHGVYPVQGEDQWVAIACETDDHWRALAQRLGRADLAGLSEEQRRERRAELDALVAAWTQPQEGCDVEAELQARSVPVHRVLYAPQLVEDPQLEHRKHFLEVPHPIHGTSWAEGSSIQLSRTPGSPKWAGPTFGQHLHEVLADVLGY